MNRLNALVTKQSRCRIFDDSKVYMAHHYFKVGTVSPNDEFELVDEVISNNRTFNLYYNETKNVFLAHRIIDDSTALYIILKNDVTCVYNLTRMFRTMRLNKVRTEINKFDCKEVTLEDEYIIIDGVGTPFESENIDDWFNERASFGKFKGLFFEDDKYYYREDEVETTSYYIKQNELIMHINFSNAIKELFRNVFLGFSKIANAFNCLRSHEFDENITNGILVEHKDSLKVYKPRSQVLGVVNDTFVCISVKNVNGLPISNGNMVMYNLSRMGDTLSKLNMAQELYKYYSTGEESLISFTDYIKTLLDKNIFREFVI